VSAHVTLADYAGQFARLGDQAQNGGAFARQDVVDSLNNALEMRKSLATNPAFGGDGSVLIPQSLETTLQVLSFEMKELKLWNLMTKKAAYAIFEEYDQLSSYGSDEIAFVDEGELPPDDDSEYDREIGQVKFLGTTRSVTLQMQLVRTISGVEPVIEQEDRNGTMQILRNLETGLFFSDDRINPQGFKGIYQQIDQRAPQNVIDMRGKPVTDKTMQDLDEASNNEYGTLDQVFMSNRAKNNLSQILQANQRTLTSEMGREVTLGVNTNEFSGNNGSFKLTSHQFIREGGAPNASAKPTAPAAPATITATPRALVGAETTQLAANTYTYEVHAFSKAGEGVGVTSLPAIVAANSAIDVVWNQVVGATYYKLYRKTNGGLLLKLKDIARGNLGTVTYTDFGTWLEGTSFAFALMYGPSGMAWKQLAPMLKLPLATIDARTRWSIFLFGVLQVYQPKKQFVLINCGDAGITHDLAIPRPRN
jgi:hypothetical protein